MDRVLSAITDPTPMETYSTPEQIAEILAVDLPLGLGGAKRLFADVTIPREDSR